MTAGTAWKWLRRLLWTMAVVLGLAAAAFAGLYWSISHPKHAPRALPAGLVALDSPEGQALLASAVQVDHAALERAFQPQEKGSWCGVASAVTTLSALRGARVAQAELFTPEAAAVRSWWQVTFGGMSLEALAGLLRAHGAPATAHHADEGVAAFRAALRRNLAAPGDYVIVNWRRDALGEEGEYGHHSPVSAYDEAGDRVLILDVGAHAYPKTWAPVERLFAAMDTVDGDGGEKRGWVEVGP
jgi:hypothetical protein